MITKEQFGLWKHEPVTKWFMEYIAAKHDLVKQVAMERWYEGSSDFHKVSDTLRGQAIELEQIRDLPYEAIKEFFDDGTKPESD